jgi:multicomponent Na+:H+ antiporter subunit E
MKLSFALNSLIAFIWLFLSTERTFTSFLAGFVIGFVLLALFAGVLGSGEYVRRLLAGMRFLVLFLKEFWISSLGIAKAILTRPNESIHPGFITYDVSELNRLEILLLTHAISLTPGTTTVEIAPDYRTVLIHCFDAVDPDAVRRQIDSSLRQYIVQFTR